jgi:hypothetical protein
VLFFGLLTLGMPVSAAAQNTSPDGSTRCDSNGNCATDALVNVVAERFPFIFNILGANPLGNLGGGLGPQINIVTPDIVQMIHDYAERQLEGLGGTARSACQAIRSDGETANNLKLAGYALAVILAVARLATQLNPSQNEDAKEILDTALVAIVAGGGVYAALDLMCRNLEMDGLI